MLDRIAERESAWLASTAPTPKVVSKQCLWQLGLARARSLFLSSKMENPSLLWVGVERFPPAVKRTQPCPQAIMNAPIITGCQFTGSQKIELRLEKAVGSIRVA